MNLSFVCAKNHINCMNIESFKNMFPKEGSLRNSIVNLYFILVRLLLHIFIWHLICRNLSNLKYVDALLMMLKFQMSICDNSMTNNYVGKYKNVAEFFLEMH